MVIIPDIKNVSSSADMAEVWPKWIDYNRRGAAAFPINNVTSDSVKERKREREE